jgi:hypothetical protein
MLCLMLLALWLQIGDILLDGRSGALEKTAMKPLGTVKLVPGMPVEAFVQTGDRNVMSQLSRHSPTRSPGLLARSKEARKDLRAGRSERLSRW